MNEFQVMAGNDLRSGRVVYLAAEGSWTDEFLQASKLSDNGDIAAAEKHAEQAVDTDQVVDPYLVSVVAGRGGMPTHIRERIRQSGPTCLPTASFDVRVAG